MNKTIRKNNVLHLIKIVNNEVTKEYRLNRLFTIYNAANVKLRISDTILVLQNCFVTLLIFLKVNKLFSMLDNIPLVKYDLLR